MMSEILFYHNLSLALGVLLDQVIGDPHFMPHPIRAIGYLISFLEKKLLGPKVLSGKRDPQKERIKGIFLWIIVVFSVAVVTLLIVLLSYGLNRYLGIAVESVLTCYILAARSLCRESMAVHREIIKGDIDGARRSLSMIVGRDTDCLNEEAVIKAAVETVAENTSDGVIAPLLYTALGGPVLGMVYKAVNTMDSMLGYHNERYESFGWMAARADDVFNFIPSRISAVMMILAAFVLGLFDRAYSGKQAFEIWKRDRNNHSSPNSAQTESVCAGALGLRLGGTHLYKGVPVEKPAIGNESRKPEPDDIKRANNLMLTTEVLTVGVIVGILWILA